MFSVKEIFAGAIAAALLLAPLAAGMIGSRTANPATVERSGATAPGDNAPPAGR